MQYFVSVVNCNSFTEAAEECFISQSAISQQIMALEGELGVQLLQREKRKFSLTKAGEYFYKQALIVLDETDRIKNETVRIAAGNYSEIRIGYLKSCSVDKLMPAIALFAKQYEDTQIHIQSGNHEELYQLLKGNELNIVINDQRRAFSDEYVNYKLMKAYSFVEINAKSHLSALGEIAPEDLKRMPCIIISSKDQQSLEMEYYKNIYGVGEDFIFAESLEEAKLLVAGNRGYCLIESSERTPKNNNYIK